jgi:hypothetical protein
MVNEVCRSPRSVVVSGGECRVVELSVKGPLRVINST